MTVHIWEETDRNADEQLGLHFGQKPKVWRVYQRKRKKGMKGNDVEGMMHGMHVMHGTSII
jgi:hypothetical protein